MATRIEEEYQAVLDALNEHPNVRLLGATGEPPERYAIEYRVQGLILTDAEREVLTPQDVHQVEFFLPPNFPKRGPRVKILTPVFHPNIDGALTTLASGWDGSQTLLDTIFRIARALAWQEYELETPLNEAAAQWLARNSDKVPTDSTDLSVPRPGAARPKKSPPEPVSVAPVLSSARLIALDTGETYQITGNITTLGRGLRNKIVLEDKGISRSHCRIERAPSGFRIVDIASTNGTFVNEQRVSQIVLHNGDTIRLGALSFRFES